MLDLPPDVPPQYPSVVIAQAPSIQQDSVSAVRAIGVCELIMNPPPPAPPVTAINFLLPNEEAWDSINLNERPTKTIDEAVKIAKVSVVQDPKHGELKNEEGRYRYIPTPDFYGQDHATVPVEIGGFKVKVMYLFRVGTGSGGGTEGYEPYKDKKNCPNGRVWKVSTNPVGHNMSYMDSSPNTIG